MTYFVTVFILESGIVDDLVGPFESEDLAWQWVTDEIAAQRHQYPSYGADESKEELLAMFSDFSDNDPHGFVYQVMEPSSPVEVIDAAAETDEP